MKRTTKLILTGAAAVTVVGIGTGATLAATGDDTEPPIRGDALDRASAAALAETGGGRVTGTEVGDEDSLYEVEVTLDDGRQVDVQLDREFRVVGSETDRHDDRDDRGDR